MALLGQIPLNTSITSADISDYAEATYDNIASVLVAGSNVTLTPNDTNNTVTIASAGGGGGANTFSDSTTLDLTVSGVDVSGNVLGISAPTASPDITATRYAAGGLRVERPSGGATILQVNAATGQLPIISFAINQVETWRFYHTNSTRLSVYDQANSKELQRFSTAAQVRFPALDNQNGVAMVRIDPDSAWPGINAGGASVRLQFVGDSGFSNADNGTRGDPINNPGANAAGSTSFVPYQVGFTTYDKVGVFTAYASSFHSRRPTHNSAGATNSTALYSEVDSYTSFGFMSSKGGYTNNAEFALSSNSTAKGEINFVTYTTGGHAALAEAGPSQLANQWHSISEYNAYSTFNDAAIFDADSWRTGGTRHLNLRSIGDFRVGTGIMMLSGASVTDEAAGESGYVRAMVLRDTTGVDIYCLDGFGRIGLGVTRDHSNNTAGLPAKLNFAVSSVEAGGINMGGDVELYRISANTLKLKDGFTINSAAGTGDANAGTIAGLYFSNAGRMDVGRNDVTLEVLRVYGVAGDANPRLRILGNGQHNWQRADGTNDFNIEPDSTTAMTGLKIGTSAAQAFGFHNATPVAQQTISGSRGGNAALADLLTKLATKGLIVDGTSA